MRAMAQKKQQELSPELKARLKEALAERFPPGWGKGKTLDEMVSESSRAALELAASLVDGEVKEPPTTGPAPICANPDCCRGKKGAARVSSKSARRPS